MSYIISEDSCTACGACADKCPEGAISKEGACYSIDAGRCSKCGTCAETCPEGACNC